MPRAKDKEQKVRETGDRQEAQENEIGVLCIYC